MYERSFLAQLVRAFDGPGSVFHVLAGPRQVGKTTIAKQLIGKLDMPSVYASAGVDINPMAGRASHGEGAFVRLARSGRDSESPGME